MCLLPDFNALRSACILYFSYFQPIPPAVVVPDEAPKAAFSRRDVRMAARNGLNEQSYIVFYGLPLVVMLIRSRVVYPAPYRSWEQAVEGVEGVMAFAYALRAIVVRSLR